LARPAVKDERREQILEGLFAAMAEEGSAGASITDIAKAAGIARGAMHYYFSSKDEIRVSLMLHLGNEYLAGLASALDRAESRGLVSGDSEAPLRALVRYHFAGDEERSARLLGVWIDFWGQAPSCCALNAVVLRTQEGARALCLRALAFAHPAVGVLPDDEQRHLAATLLALVEGCLLQWRVSARSERPLERAALARRVRAAASALARSLEEAS
jgi:AcrR family transcriptional regulator